MEQKRAAAVRCSEWLGVSLWYSDSISHLCIGGRDPCAPLTGPGRWQSDKKLYAGSRGGYHGDCRTVIAHDDAILSGVLVVGKNAESRVVQQRALSRECHENTIALPPANGGFEVGRQSGWKQKADVLLVEVLEWYHDE